MIAILSLILALSAITSSTAEFTAKEFTYWKKADITAWHTYFPSRALEEEWMTYVAAKNAVESVSQGLEESLIKLVTYPEREWGMSYLIFQGTSAQGCMEGISSLLTDAIHQEKLYYDDCTADALPKLQRLYNTLTRVNSSYQTAYQRALQGIDTCATTYPNKNSLNRLKNCVDTWNDRYFAFANKTRYNVFSSPSMNVFTNTVGVCAETAARGVVSKAWQFLIKLVQCAKLSDNVNSQTYEVEVTTGYLKYLTQNDLVSQTFESQFRNNVTVSYVQESMIFYYNLQRRALENYVIESRGQSHYSNQLAGYLNKYYTTVHSTSNDNPDGTECTSKAITALSDIVNQGSLEALQCDQLIVNDTKLRIREVNEEFTKINTILPGTGNVAILDCFRSGYVFMEKTISKCFNQKADEFDFNLLQTHKSIDKNVEILQGYERSFFINSSTPCLSSILQKTTLKAHVVLYNLERCLYISSGTKYDVTIAPSINENNTTPTPV